MKDCDLHMTHEWYYWEHEGYELRKCKWCHLIQAKGPGGWTDVP